MGGKTTQTSQTSTIPPDVLARYNSVNAQAQQAAATPFKTYSGQFVAPLNDTQNAGIANTNAAANQAQSGFQSATGVAQGSYAGAQPYNQGATAYALAGGNAVNPSNVDASAINKYMNPYLQDVLGSTSQLLQQDNAKAQSGALGSAIQSGAFGGDRAGIGAANLQQQQNLANANIYSNIASQGFNTALGAAQQQQGVSLSADQANRAALQQTSGALAGIGNQQFTQGQTEAGTEAGLASGAQSAALQGAQAQLQAGGVQQQTQQAQDSALYNQFQQQQSYPFQTTQFLANIAEGTAQGQGTTTQTQPGSIFSDERLKEDIRAIGKTNDGQTIYSYRYKGDNKYQIGLLAQEVEKHHPEAVGLAGGYKTVDYHKATQDAERHHRALGGGMPYSTPQNGLDIPDDQPKNAGYQPVKMDDGSSAAQGDMNTIMTAGKLAMMLKTGGRAMRADGGGLAGADDGYGDIPLPDLNEVEDPGSAKLVTGLAAVKSPPETPKPTGLAPPPKEQQADPDDIVTAIAKAEGIGKNPNSSARGAFQFTDPTFVGMFKSMFPGRAKGMSDSEIVALRNTPEGDQLSAAMGPEFTHQNMQKLAAAGHAPTAGNTYLAHFLGPQGALHILSSPSNAPLERLLPKQVINANPTVLKGKNVGDLLTWASNTVGKFMPRSERAAGGRAGYALDGFVDGDGPDDNSTGLAAGIDTFAPPDSGGSGLAPTDSRGDDNTVAPVVVKQDKTQPTGVKPGPQEHIQGPPELLNRSLPNVQAAPDPDAKPKLPKDPNIIDGITKFAKNTIDGIGGAATRMGDSLVDTKGSDDQYGIHHGPADYIIPLLTGLAGAGADRSGSLGGALAAGLGAGAQAYQHQRDFGQKQQQINTQRMVPNAHIAELAQNAAARNVELFDQAWMPDPTHAGQYVSRYGGQVVDGDTLGKMRAQYTDQQWGQARQAVHMAADPRTPPGAIADTLSALTPKTGGIIAPAGGAQPAAPAQPASGGATPAAAPAAAPAAPAQPSTPVAAPAAAPAAPVAPYPHPAHTAHQAAAPGPDALATGKPVTTYTTAMTAGHSGGGEDPAALEAQAQQILTNKYATPEQRQYAEGLRSRAAVIRQGGNDPDQQAAVANTNALRAHYTERTKQFNTAAAEYATTSQQQKMLEDSVIHARQNTNLNARSGEISNLIGTLRSYLPNNPMLANVFSGLDKINGDQAIVDKDTARLNLLQGAASSLGSGAPAATLGQTALANPDSHAPPEAAREAMVQMRAQRLQQKAFFDDWAKDGPKIAAANGNVDAYAADWRNDPRHRLELYQKVADKQVPLFGGQAGGAAGGRPAPKPVGTAGGQPVYRHPDGTLRRTPPQ